MTTKERLHQLVDDLSDVEAADVLRVVEARRSGAWWAQQPATLHLDAEQTKRLLDALDHPERFDVGLGDLAARAAEYRRA